MADFAARFENNPIFVPSDIIPSQDNFEVECVLNPGAFHFQDRVGVLLRVAERPHRKEGIVSIPIINPLNNRFEIMEINRSDPDLDMHDPRLFTYRGRTYLTTISHFRLAWSDDDQKFKVEDKPALTGHGPLESYGIEDCRVSFVEDKYVLTYSAVSQCGIGIGMALTKDWNSYTRMGMAISPDNKDCALFGRKIVGQYLALHRPANYHIMGRHIWLAASPDMIHWGEHKCIAMTRPGMWDSERMGCGGPPIETDHGWLVIYHGADDTKRYCLGALLLDHDDPSRVLARSEEPFMEPVAPYELQGFFGNVVFSNGHIVNGDTITLYYGASDTVVCGATVSMRAILNSLIKT